MRVGNFSNDPRLSQRRARPNSQPPHSSAASKLLISPSDDLQKFLHLCMTHDPYIPFPIRSEKAFNSRNATYSTAKPQLRTKVSRSIESGSIRPVKPYYCLIIIAAAVFRNNCFTVGTRIIRGWFALSISSNASLRRPFLHISIRDVHRVEF